MSKKHDFIRTCLMARTWGFALAATGWAAEHADLGYRDTPYLPGNKWHIQYPPRVSAVKPPGEWQCYDIVFESPRWDDQGNLIKAGNVTALLNGLLLHHKQEFIGEVAHRQLAKYHPLPPHGPIQLQDHGNPVRFRNIWIRSLGQYDPS
jgi:3-keto-disaccharide hydrolase